MRLTIFLLLVSLTVLFYGKSQAQVMCEAAQAKQAIVWQAHHDNLGAFTALANGGLFHNGDVDKQSYVVSTTQFNGPVRVEFTVYEKSGKLYNFPAQAGIQVVEPVVGGRFAFFMGAFYNNPLVVTAYSVSPRTPYVAGDRFAIEVSNGTVKYFKNYNGSTSTPFFVGPNPVPAGPWEVFVIMTGTISPDEGVSAATFQTL